MSLPCRWWSRLDLGLVPFLAIGIEHPMGTGLWTVERPVTRNRLLAYSITRRVVEVI